MIDWKIYNSDSLPKDGDYLVTDGKYFEVASVQSFEYGEGPEPELFLPDLTPINGRESVTHYAEINLPDGRVNQSNRYELLLDPGKPGSYKTKYLHEAENDEQALEQAKAYAEKKGWEIARLSKEIKGTLDLIPFNHARRA